MADEEKAAGNGGNFRRSFAPSTCPFNFPPIPLAPTFSIPYTSLRLMGNHLSGPVDRHNNSSNSAVVSQAPPWHSSPSLSLGVPQPSSMPVSSSEYPMALTPRIPTVSLPSQQPPVSFSTLLTSEIAAPTPWGLEAAQHSAVPALNLAPAFVPPTPHFSQLPFQSSNPLPGKEGSTAVSNATLIPASSVYSAPAAPFPRTGIRPANFSLPLPPSNQLNINHIKHNGVHVLAPCDQTIVVSPPIPSGVTRTASLPSSDPLLVTAEPPPVPENYPRDPVPLAARGEGWPYAPQGWPNSDDVWGWRVGKRTTVNSHWMDRYISLPKNLAKGRKVVEFASRKSLIEYLKQTFPHMNADSIFKAFDWKVPAPKAIEASRGPPTKREKPSPGTGDSSWQRPKKRCQADNPHCGLETGKSSVSGSVESLACQICCTELGFCRECKCILCCKPFQPDSDEISVIRCFNRPLPGAGICGHAAHLECALNSQLAGVIKKNGLDVEYMCRRCDRKTDLRKTVTGLVKAVGKTTARTKVERYLRLALHIMQDPQEGVVLPARTLATVIELTLKKVEMGADLQEAYRGLTEHALAAEAGQGVHESQVSHQVQYWFQVLGPKATTEGLSHQSEASLDKWLPSSSSLGSRPCPTTPSNSTPLGESQSMPAVSNQLPADGNDTPHAAHIKTTNIGEQVADAVASTSGTNVQSMHSNIKVVASPLLQTRGEPKPSAAFVSGLFGQTMSKPPALSIEEHMKQCEAIANRVKCAGQLTAPPARPPAASHNHLSGGDPALRSSSLETATPSAQFVKNQERTCQTIGSPPAKGVEDKGSSWRAGRSLAAHTHMVESPSLPYLQPMLTSTGTHGDSKLIFVELPVVPCSQAALESCTEGLEAELEDHIRQALKKLKKVQAAEYARAEESLLTQKRVVLEQHWQLENARQDFAKQGNNARDLPPHCSKDTSEQGSQTHPATTSLVAQFGKALQKERKVFQSMLAISDGFGQVSKERLQEHFGWPPQDSAGV